MQLNCSCYASCLVPTPMLTLTRFERRLKGSQDVLSYILLEFGNETELLRFPPLFHEFPSDIEMTLTSSPPSSTSSLINPLHVHSDSIFYRSYQTCIILRVLALRLGIGLQSGVSEALCVAIKKKQESSRTSCFPRTIRCLFVFRKPESPSWTLFASC
jgi:hypothetical protein